MKMGLKKVFQLPSGRQWVIGLPFVWLSLFFLLPFCIVLKISLAEMTIAIPPYTALVEYVDQQLRLVLNFSNYVFLSEDELYWAAYLGSLKIAAISTAWCLVLGYPMAYALSRLSRPCQWTLLLLIMMPTWTALLIRIYAWMGILGDTGVVNTLLLGVGLIDKPLPLMHSDFAVYIGMVYAYLPFMILPLYATLSRQDPALLEAAADLGASRLVSFWTITVPLSRGGILAGCLLVFIPAVGEFVIPELLGGSDTLMIGKVLWQEFFSNRDWPVASALAVIMLLILMVPILWFIHRSPA